MYPIALIAGVISGIVISSYNYYSPPKKLFMLIGIVLTVLIMVIFPYSDFVFICGLAVLSLLITVLLTNTFLNPVH